MAITSTSFAYDEGIKQHGRGNRVWTRRSTDLQGFMYIWCKGGVEGGWGWLGQCGGALRVSPTPYGIAESCSPWGAVQPTVLEGPHVLHAQTLI